LVQLFKGKGRAAAGGAGAGKRLKYFFYEPIAGENEKKAHPHVSPVVFPAHHLHGWGYKMRFQTSVRASFHFGVSCGEITCFKRAMGLFANGHVIRS
jgi:hypothetical protein